MEMHHGSRLLLALAIGLVVGIERGWRERDQPAGSRTAGIRTYSLSGLLGGVCALLSDVLASPAILAVGMIGFLLVFAAFRLHEAIHDVEFSVTGVIAAALVFGLGALAVLGDPRVAAAAGVTVAGVLACRDLLHSLLARVTWIELRSALLLLAMTVVVLPLLPDRALDPHGGFNPREIWLMSILVAGLSFAGYIATRVFGLRHGIAVAGAIGGLVSSTAVTVAFARRARGGEAPGALAAGAAIAGAVSLLRVGLIGAMIAPAVAATLALPLVVAAIGLAAAAVALLYHMPKGAPQDIPLGNPFDLGPVIGFAAFLGVVAFATAYAAAELGTGSLVAVAAVSGLADVDAVVLSAARLAGGTLSPADAALAILVAASVNAAMRAVYGLVIAGPAFGLRLGAATALAFAAGGGALAIAIRVA